MEKHEKLLIVSYEKALHEQYQESKEKHGAHSDLTKNSFARWEAVRGLLELMKEEGMI